MDNQTIVGKNTEYQDMFYPRLKWDFLLNSICKTISFIYSQVKRRKEIQKIWWELASQRVGKNTEYQDMFYPNNNTTYLK
jgi:hypothetical protein